MEVTRVVIHNRVGLASRQTTVENVEWSFRRLMILHHGDTIPVSRCNDMIAMNQIYV